MLNGITRHLSRTFIVACAAGIGLLAAASPASASPDRARGHNHGRSDDRVVIRANVNFGSSACAPSPHFNKGRIVVHGDHCGCDACGIKREYARGVNRGEAAGSNQGFRDGLAGKPFCADVRDDLCHESKVFVDGYMKAFGESYRCAFERGRMERARACAPVHRPRCP